MGMVLIGTISPANESTDELIAAALQIHISDFTPHPSYDEMQSLVGLFENGLT